MSIVEYLVLFLMFVVVGVLVGGIINFARGASPQRSNRLMVWRVGLQGLVIMLAALFLTRS